MTEVEAHMTACVCFLISYFNYGLLGRPYLWTVCTMAEVALGKDHVFTIRDLLCPCTCPSLVHACVAIVAALTDS